ncbi:MAG TPA: zf-HC2 domain-containing protein, partial [Gemmatimonadales bacterium]|nr:zf-HC2 domain-containing protein [Gemmatimonadales bacterium]
MQHLEDGYLHEIADGEVPSEELVLVREHLDACESCRARLDEARHEAEMTRELIGLIEVPVGAV